MEVFKLIGITTIRIKYILTYIDTVLQGSLSVTITLIGGRRKNNLFRKICFKTKMAAVPRIKPTRQKIILQKTKNESNDSN